MVLLPRRRAACPRQGAACWSLCLFWLLVGIVNTDCLYKVNFTGVQGLAQAAGGRDQQGPLGRHPRQDPPRRTSLAWGTGTACASDAKKSGSWSSNLMTEYHVRYGGHGVMIYWHVEKKSLCVYGRRTSPIKSSMSPPKGCAGRSTRACRWWRTG